MFKIGNRIISSNHKPYIIAEACINHEGNMKLAEKMVTLAAKAGASAIKFQMHVLDDEMLKKTPKSSNFDESLYDALDRTNFNTKQHIYLKKLCKINNIDYLCTPFSRKSVNILYHDVRVKVFKVGSGELTNIPLQEFIAKKKLPTIISTGMSTLKEVKYTFDQVYKINKKIILTQCTSIYPCPYEYSDIGVITQYRDEFSVPIGLSDHTNSIYTSLGAVALGACLIEKHFTTDKNLPGPDHKASVLPDEFTLLVNSVRKTEQILGKKEKICQKEESQMALVSRKSLTLIQSLKKGDQLEEKHFTLKRPGTGLFYKDLKKILGRKVKKSLKQDYQIKFEDLE